MVHQTVQQEPTFSFFQAPIQNTKPSRCVTISDIGHYIANDQKAEANTLALRKLSSADDARKFKASHFDFCTFSGVFSKREAKSLIAHSGLLCLDFDHIEKPEELKEELVSDPHFVSRLAFISPSGQGLKWIIDVPLKGITHGEYFAAVTNYLKQNHEIDTDPSGKDIPRSCFLPHDPDVYIDADMTHQAVQPFIPTEWQGTELSEEGSIAEDIDSIVRQIVSSGKDITIDYPTWCSIGFALCDALGENGRNYFHEVSRFYPGYKWEECEAQYDKCLAGKGSGITANTFFFLAEKAGFKAKRKQRTSETSRTSRTSSEVSADFADSKGDGSKNIVVPPLIPLTQQVKLDTLPDILSRVLSHATTSEEADILLLGSIVTLSSCLPNIFGRYDKRDYHANLYLFVTAPASAGKGSITHCKNLVKPIHDRKRESFARKMKAYNEECRRNAKNKEQSEDTAPEPPKLEALLIPANSGSTALYQMLNDNDGRGLIFETEGDELVLAIRNDFSNYVVGLRKAFQHESVSYMRRQNQEYVSIDEPKLTVVMTGTPQQVINFIPNTEDGLFSRFIFYYLELDICWHNVFNDCKTSLDDAFLTIGSEFIKFYDKLDNRKTKVQFFFAPHQIDHFNEFFDKAQNEYYTIIGISILASVRRMGLITFRIAMILTALRHMDDEIIPTKLICEDKDYFSAIAIAKVALQHTAYILQRFPRLQHQINQNDGGPIKAEKQKQLYSILPTEFNKQTWNECAKQAGINVKTAERYLPIWCESGILMKIEMNHYKKVQNFLQKNPLENPYDKI